MYGCDFKVLDNEELFLETFKKAVEEAKMTLLNLSSHQFKPFGVTALALLSESHMSIHTYPELGYAAADVFTCGDEGDPFKAMEVLIETLKPERRNIIYIPRGTDIQDKDKSPEAFKILEDYIKQNE
jgi:S-adenosylmethionine decarboxylase